MNARTLRLRLTGNRTRYRNWLNRRARARGKAPLPDRVARYASPLPVYRNRINRATGRPRGDDRRIGALQDQALAQAKAQDDARAARAEHNQRFVRETLAGRQPQYARLVARTAESVDREMAARQPARSRSRRSR